MTRDEKLKALAQVLMLAAEKAHGLSSSAADLPPREAALAKQIEGIAMEFEALSFSPPAGKAEDDPGA